MRVGIKHALFLVVVACGFAGNSAKACKLNAKFNQPQSSAALTTPSAALTKPAVALNDANNMPAHERTIVGLWNEEYDGIDGTVVAAFDTFYADGNELLIANSPPANENVCSGVWEQTGPFTYEVNHPSWDFDASGNLIGIVVLRSCITVDEHGNKFTGTESFTEYDPNDPTLSTVIYQSSGTLTGVRIHVKSSPL